jgi:hypothetical protein
MNYNSERVVVGVVGPTPTFLSQHTCILNVVFSTAMTRGTYIPPVTQLKHFLDLFLGMGPVCIVKMVEGLSWVSWTPLPAFLSHHKHILYLIVSHIMTGGLWNPPACSNFTLCNLFFEGEQLSQQRLSVIMFAIVGTMYFKINTYLHIKLIKYTERWFDEIGYYSYIAFVIDIPLLRGVVSERLLP